MAEDININQPAVAWIEEGNRTSAKSEPIRKVWTPPAMAFLKKKKTTEDAEKELDIGGDKPKAWFDSKPEKPARKLWKPPAMGKMERYGPESKESEQVSDSLLKAFKEETAKGEIPTPPPSMAAMAKDIDREKKLQAPKVAPRLRFTPINPKGLAARGLKTNLKSTIGSSFPDEHWDLSMNVVANVYSKDSKPDSDMRRLNKISNILARGDAKQAKAIKRNILKDVERYAEFYSKHYGLGDLIPAIIKRESRFDPYAQSQADALGPGQFMAGSWKLFSEKIFGKGINQLYRMHPKVSMMMTAEHLIENLSSINRMTPYLSKSERHLLAAKAYNGGIKDLPRAIRRARKKYKTDKPTFKQIKYIYDRLAGKTHTKERSEYDIEVKKNLDEIQKRRKVKQDVESFKKENLRNRRGK